MERKEIDAQNGLSLLEVAHNNGISLEGAWPDLARSTCHIILEKIFSKTLNHQKKRRTCLI